MSYSSTVRNLRDGQITISDGSSPPKSVTLACDMGDLKWSVRKEYRINRCRGILGTKRLGDDQETNVSFTTKVSQLIAFTEDSSDPVTPYEILENVGGVFTSVADGHYAVKLEFTISDPDNGSGTDEVITFAAFAPESTDFSEGDDADTLSVSGNSFETHPTIERV